MLRGTVLMAEHVLIGFLTGLIAHVYYIKTVYRIKLEINLFNSKRRKKQQERERSACKQRTKLTNPVNN